MKPPLVVVSTATILLTALAGCTTAASPSSPTVSPATPTPTPSAAPLTTQQLCLTKFSKAELLAWSPATVKDFRTFQYGGPKANVPLADAFPGVVETTKGAWCGTNRGKDTIRWWAVVAGQQPARVIDINGPGEGKYRGAVTPPAIRIPAPNATHS
jgi:hypothetical protein